MTEVTRAIADGGERIRDDVRVPVLVFQSETDVILLGGGKADQPTPTGSACGSWPVRPTPTPTSSAQAAMTTGR